MYDPYNPYETEQPKIEVNFKRNRVSSKKAGIGTVNAGGAIIIIIFVVLCLTIFGLLSFTTSFADKKLADRNLQSVSQYYRADSEAEEKIAVIYNALYEKINSGANFSFNESFVDSVVKNISNAKYDFSDMEVWEPWDDTGVDENTDAVIIFYHTDMGAGASKDAKVKFLLDTELKLYYNKNTGKLTYKISEWKVRMESGFDYDNEIYNLWTFGGDDDDDYFDNKDDND